MYPKVNQNIIVKVSDHDNSWKTIVADVREKDILIGVPIDISNFGLFQVGTIIEVIYTQDISRFRFFTEIIGRKNENIPLLIVNKPAENEISKIQLRENFRVNVSVPIFLNGKESKTINLSAGGLLCTYSKDFGLKEGEMVSGTLFLPGVSGEAMSSIFFQSEIVRVDLVKELDRVYVGLKFVEIDFQDQKKITHYCIEKQRQLRQKERDLNLF